MAKYMMLWEIDTSRTPEDPKVKKAQWMGFNDIVANHLKEGFIKDWGCFVGDKCGYIIFEGTPIEVHALAAKWLPFIQWTVKELMTLDDAIKATKALPD
jgi:hypothetical protein